MPMEKKLEIAVGGGGGGLVFLAVIVWTCLRVRAKRAAGAAAAGIYSQYACEYLLLVHRQICTIALPNMYLNTDSWPVAVGYPCSSVEACKAVDCIVVMENDSECARVSGSLVLADETKR